MVVTSEMQIFKCIYLNKLSIIPPQRHSWDHEKVHFVSKLLIYNCLVPSFT